MIQYVEYISLLIIPLFILFTVLYGTFKKVRVYDSFVAGAKEGPAIILNIFPYLVTIFVAIKGFQSSGAFDYIKSAFYSVFAFMQDGLPESGKPFCRRFGNSCPFPVDSNIFTG